MKAAQQQNHQTKKRETCALFGHFTSKDEVMSESFMTTADAVKKASDVPALLIPKVKLLGDYDVCAGEEGTPEVTKKYMAMTPGQFNEQLNTIIYNALKEQTIMDTTPQVDTAQNCCKLKSFNEFPVGRTDLDDVAIKAGTPAVITMDFHGNETHTTLLGTTPTPVKSASTVEMTPQKEQAIKRLQTFLGTHARTTPTGNPTGTGVL